MPMPPRPPAPPGSMSNGPIPPPPPPPGKFNNIFMNENKLKNKISFI